MFCNSCGNQINDTSRFCRFCGMPVFLNLENSEAKTTEQNSFAFCGKCGTKLELEKGINYCDKCGFPIHRNKGNLCRICSEKLEKGSLFCSNCGAAQ